MHSGNVWEIADGRCMTLSELADVINSKNEASNLSSAIRLFVLDFSATDVRPSGAA